MLRSFLLLIFTLSLATSLSAQITDSTNAVPRDTPTRVVKRIAVDTIRRTNDSLYKSYPPDTVSRRPRDTTNNWRVAANMPLAQQVLQHHPYIKFNEKAVVFRSDLKIFYGKELFFYVLIALLLVFALLKLAFSKYFNDMFRVFFRTTMKQRQIREQLIQTPLPSLLFNMFFVAVGGLYISLLFSHYDFKPIDNFWLLYFYICLGLAVIYFVKFIGLKICGWMFNMRQAADSYIFIVFIINKVIGIFLLPFLLILAFANEPLYTISMIVSWCGLTGLFLYRFILGYSAVRNEVRFNLFHFFLYLCAFEIAPLLLIYRALLFFFK